MINPNGIQVPDEAMPAVVAPAKKLDLACGRSKAEGFLGVDVAAVEGVDIVHDLTVVPWPIEDESIDEARCAHFFEHLDPKERIGFMNELYRVLKKGSGCMFVTPRGFDRQVQDFTHKWPPVVESTFFYFDHEFYKLNKLEHYLELHGIKCNFEARPIEATVSQEFATRSDEQKMFAVRHYMNAAMDLIVLVVKR